MLLFVVLAASADVSSRTVTILFGESASITNNNWKSLSTATNGGCLHVTGVPDEFGMAQLVLKVCVFEKSTAQDGGTAIFSKRVFSGAA